MSRLALVVVILAFVITVEIDVLRSEDTNISDKTGKSAKNQRPNARVNANAKTNTQGKSNSQPAQETKIATSQQCQREVSQICKDVPLNNNFLVLECLQQDAETYEQLGASCQRFIWSFKRNLTLNTRFAKLAQSACGEETLNRTGCTQSVDKKGHLMTCLIENMRNVTVEHCRIFLTKMASMIFTDYRLIEGFYEKCDKDIERLRCARLEHVDFDEILQKDEQPEGSETEVEMPLHQGQTISCLQTKMESEKDVSPDCRVAILRVSELQANDYTLDRPLYYACRADRDSFCHEVEAGEGRVYACLMQHQAENGFSSACRNELHRREVLIEQDVSIDKRFYDACNSALTTYKCGGSNGDGMQIVDLAHALVCLNDAINEGDPLTALMPVCRAQLSDLHTRLFANQPVSAKVISSCGAEIQANCYEERFNENVAELFHCLMEHAVAVTGNRKPDNRPADADSPHPGLSQKCFVELRTLVREADVVQDMRVDPVLYEACESVANVACADALTNKDKDRAHDSASLFVCLVEQMANDKVMTAVCAKRLMEIEYFVTRDYHLDGALLRACRRDAREQCHAGDRKWFEDHPNVFQQIDQGEAVEPVGTNELEETPKSNRKDDESEVGADFGDGQSQLERKKRAPLQLEDQSRRRKQSKSDLVADDVDEDIIELEHEDFVLPCLFGLMKKDKLEDACAVEVRRTMRERTMFVGLMPEIERACFYDLSKLCSENEHVHEAGAELTCLEENFASLHPRCRMMVANYSRDVSIDASIDFYTYRLCATSMRTFCKPILNQQSTWKHALDVHVLNEVNEQHETLIDCLIDHKDEVPEGCRLAVTHHQRVAQLESTQVSVSLFRACRADAKALCPNQELSPKKDILNCLSEVWTIDYLRLNGIFYNETSKVQTAQYEADLANSVSDHVEDEVSASRISKPCLKQLEREFLQQEEDVELDDVVLGNCRADIKDHCPDFDPKKDARGQIVECLKENYEVLQETCRFVLFKHELRDTVNQNIDYGLKKDCGKMILKYCAEAEPSEILECLKAKKREDDFDDSCLQVVVTREVIQAQDIRLNPKLTKACRTDVQRLCTAILKNHTDNQRRLAQKLDEAAARNAMRGRVDEHELVENRLRQHRSLAYEYHGEVIHCLREQYVKNVIDVQMDLKTVKQSELLSEQCGDQLRLMMRESALNFHLDPVFKGACINELQLCSDVLENPSFLAGNRVVSSQNDAVRNLRLGAGIDVRIGVSRVEDCLKEHFSKSANQFGTECKKEMIRLFQEARADVHVDPILHKACALDLAYYCQGVPLGMGQQFSCLLHALDAKESKPILRPECVQKLRERMEMFNAAMEVAPFHSLQDMIDQTVSSPHRVYFLGVLICLTLAVFVIGIACGCTTRRQAKLVQKSK